MKLAFNLQAAGFSAEELKTNCVVVLEEGSITQSNLELTATVPNVTEEQFAELVKDAELNCPVSKVLNATVSVSYTLQN
jgi:osmotically inducible protein OsmC